MVFYRKYRPQTISELDLASVREKLASILKAKDLPHAFLFTGPRGLGKTSTARILAKAINCEKRDGGIEPCNKCDSCRSITSGSNLDVLEIDAASNRGIDEIRDLREKIKFAPAILSKKVYIIDEVHMLTTDAFNALLKTLEEPPSHAMFILCTTEVEKIPATISSRTFQVFFEKPTVEEVKKSIAKIITGEKIEIDDAVLTQIFKLSGGSFRDAAKIIEELSIAGHGKITKETAEKVFKTESSDIAIENLLNALTNKDAESAFLIIQNLADNGADFKIITEKLATILHGVILNSVGIAGQEVGSTNINASDASVLLSKINESYKEIKTSILPQIPIEIIIAEWCASGETKKEETVLKEKEVSRPEEKIEIKAIVESVPVVEEKNVQKDEIVESDSSSNEKERDHGELYRKDALPENFFAALLVRVKQDNHSIAGILRGCKLVNMTDETIHFETLYKFHRDKLSEPKTIDILNKRSSEILKKNVIVRVEIKSK